MLAGTGRSVVRDGQCNCFVIFQGPQINALGEASQGKILQRTDDQRRRYSSGSIKSSVEVRLKGRRSPGLSKSTAKKETISKKIKRPRSSICSCSNLLASKELVETREKRGLLMDGGLERASSQQKKKKGV